LKAKSHRVCAYGCVHMCAPCSTAQGAPVCPTQGPHWDRYGQGLTLLPHPGPASNPGLSGAHKGPLMSLPLSMPPKMEAIDVFQRSYSSGMKLFLVDHLRDSYPSSSCCSKYNPNEGLVNTATPPSPPGLSQGKGSQASKHHAPPCCHTQGPTPGMPPFPTPPPSVSW
jgi:hypothetical protein